MFQYQLISDVLVNILVQAIFSIMTFVAVAPRGAKISADLLTYFISECSAPHGQS